MKLTLAEARDALGVTEDATPEVERQAYRRLALRFHPDKNKDPGATAAFQRVSAAYKRVSDHRERQDKRRASSGGFCGSNVVDSDSDEDFDGMPFEDADFEDLDEMLFMFQMLFGGGLSRKNPGSKGKSNNSKKKTASSSNANSGTTSAKPPSVSVNIGGRRRKLGKQQHKRTRGRYQADEAFDDEMRKLFESAMFGGAGDDPFDIGGVGGFGGLDVEDEEDLMEMASFFMGGHPDVSAFAKFDDALSDDSIDSIGGKMDNQDTSEFEEKTSKRDNQSGEAKGDAEVKVAPLEVNADVRVYGRLSGVIRFVGEVHYAKGSFVGVELSDPVGKNDGTVKGVQYFSCTPSHGLMVRPDDVVPSALAGGA